MIKIRKIKKKDFKNVKKLFLRNKLNFLSLDEWNNMWSNPHFVSKKNWALGWVAFYKNNLVGHIGNTPRVYSLKNKKIICSNINSWVVDKKHRYLSVILFKKLSEEKADFQLSSTTSTQAALIFKKFGIDEIPNPRLKKNLLIIFNFEKVIKLYSKTKNYFLSSTIKFFKPAILNFFRNRTNIWANKSTQYDIIKLIKFDKRFDKFWDNYKKQNRSKLILERSSKWQNWLLKYSIKKGKISIFTCQRKNTILGYSIVKIVDKKKYKYARLLDLIVLNNNKNIINDLIVKGLTFAKIKKCVFFEFRYSSKRVLKELKKYRPYLYRLKNNDFYYSSNKSLKNKFKSNAEIFEPSNLDGDIVNTLNNL